MSTFEYDAAIAGAKEAASAASYDIQKLPEDSIERQALHGLVTAIDRLIEAFDAQTDAEE